MSRPRINRPKAPPVRIAPEPVRLLRYLRSFDRAEPFPTSK